MRKFFSKSLYALVALLVLVSTVLTACGSATQKPLPPIVYQGDGCNATGFPLGKEREIAPGVTVTIDWQDRFVRDNTSISGWVVAINENGSRRVLAFGDALVYSSQPGEGWAGKPADTTMALSVFDKEGNEYTFASVYTDTLELNLLCQPLVEEAVFVGCTKLSADTFLYTPSGATMSYRIIAEDSIVFTLNYPNGLMTTMDITGYTRTFIDQRPGQETKIESFDLSGTSGAIELYDTANTDQYLDYGVWNLDTHEYTEPSCKPSNPTGADA